jgi:L-lactate dehydrogenase
MGHPHRVAIIGAGHVGATTAYALLLSGLTPEIVLVDRDVRRAEGEAMDLMHAVPFADPVRVWAGTWDDAAESAIVVLSAGVGQAPGETRLQLIARNAAIFRDIVPRVASRNPDVMLLVATNPVDVLTWASLKASGLPRSQVIGSGTILDTARFRALLSRHLGVEARSVHAYVIGEHGDSEVAVWSLANVGGIPLADFQATTGQTLDAATRQAIVEDTRRAAYQIIERKGATYYAVAAGIVRIIQAVLRDESTVLTVSSLVSGCYGLGDVCLSLPCILNRTGVVRALTPPLSAGEVDGLQQSARVLIEAQGGLERGSGDLRIWGSKDLGI